ncbi:putative F-box protein At3g51171 [Bidens hawaiensis]|uniref:putative F-box protein At3g51171 n=1 Tax=Bidens hawaiensis TaxID=980011 RepID=UPI004049EC34
MSNNIPFEIQVEIIKRLPVKPLIQYRSVLKQWKSLIDSSEFIVQHNRAQPLHLLIRHKVPSEEKYALVVDDDCFPHHKPPIVSPILKPGRYGTMLGCSNGLVCLHGSGQDKSKSLIVIWNPSIRKSVGIELCIGYDDVGFGVCPKTSDPKIVKISTSAPMDKKAEVFSLSSGAWRSVPLNLHNITKFWFYQKHVVIDGVIYWLAFDCNFLANKGSWHARIISFDLTSEEFGEVDLPDYLAGPRDLNISNLKESLVVLNYYNHDAGKHVCDAWMMLKNGVLKSSFTKLFTFQVNKSNGSSIYNIIGFRTNGQLIIEPKVKPYCDGEKELQVYDPSQDI